MQTQTKDLEKLKARWQKEREATNQAREDLHDMIHEASEAGMSQAEIGRVLGWPRQRVNTILQGG